MAIRFIGGDVTDTGPIGVIARFLLAAEVSDEESARELLTGNSRHGFDINAIAITSGTVRFDDVVMEAGNHVVPTIIEDEDGAEEMPFILREEGGELLIDFDATIARLMGVSMDDFLEEMGESVADDVETGVEGVGKLLSAGLEILADGASPLDAFEDPPGDNEPGQWHIPDPAAADFRERMLDIAFDLVRAFPSPFRPSRDVVDSDEWKAEGASVTTERYGTEEAGLQRNETLSDTGEQRRHTVEVAGYGMPDARELRLFWLEAGAPGEAPVLTVFVQAVAPLATHAGIREYLVEHFGWEDPLG